MGEQRVGHGLAAAGGEGPEAAAGERDAGELERPHDVLLPLAFAVHALAQVEDEVRRAADLEPAHAVPDAEAPDVVAHRVEDHRDFAHGSHDAADVFGRPVFRPRVVQDDDLHADASRANARVAGSRTGWPVRRRHAMCTTSWMSSS